MRLRPGGPTQPQVSGSCQIAIRASWIMAEPLSYRWADATPLTTQIYGVASIALSFHLLGIQPENTPKHFSNP